MEKKTDNVGCPSAELVNISTVQTEGAEKKEQQQLHTKESMSDPAMSILPLPGAMWQ